jgi:hypothetical protein
MKERLATNCASYGQCFLVGGRIAIDCKNPEKLQLIALERCVDAKWPLCRSACSILFAKEKISSITKTPVNKSMTRRAFPRTYPVLGK